MKSALLIIVFSFIFPITAHGAQNANCNFAPKVKELQSLKTTPLEDQEEQASKELSLRKELLSQIIQCNISSLESLSRELQNLPSNNFPEVDDLKKIFVLQVTDANLYLEKQNEKVESLDIEDSKNISKDMLSWQTDFFNPLSERIHTFTLWASNQDLLSRAEKRLNQINFSLQYFKIGENDNVQQLLQKARTYFLQASETNFRARQSLERTSPPDEALDYTKSSLESLYKTYQNLIDLSKSISKLYK